MKFQRNVNVYIVEDYNELAKCVNEKRTVIFIEGKLFNDMKLKAELSKNKKLTKVAGGVGLVSFVLTGGLFYLLLGGSMFLYGKFSKDDFKDYKIKFNNNRIELYLNKGKDKFDPKYDTLVFPDKSEQ